MIAPERTLLVLLAAGQSLRFGTVDKLTAEYLGRPLALHVVIALEDIPFMARVAITSGTQLDFGAFGYRVIGNPAPEAGLSGSVRLAAQAAQNAGADAVLIALADMPRVTAAHMLRLLEGLSTPNDVIASSDGINPSPPALFGAGRFAELANATGDEGARAMVRAGRHVIAGPGELVDIDTPEDLELLRARC